MGMAAMLAGCGQNMEETTAAPATTLEQETADAPEEETAGAEKDVLVEGAVNIQLSDSEILVNGEKISDRTDDAVYAANDIVYYEEGKDFKYGEGTETDAHSKEEADAHTVVHITKPGTYAVSGKLSAGQIAVDLGEDAEADPKAVVTLILNGVDITNTVAPAVLVYNVYECGPADEEHAAKDVDTANAGMNLVIADGTENHINGSYVAKIYKSIELNEDGTKVIDSKKLHKYDGAIQSKMSMNVNGGDEGTGILNIKAENEGLGSAYHLTVNGGNINIVSGNDGINTSEDYVSVTTINGGAVKILVDGSTGEGDGIDSNGWLVINGGTVIAEGCADSIDAGIDSDKGIHINGGTVIATGNMLDHISESEQPFAVFTFTEKQKGGKAYTLKDANGNEVLSGAPENAFTYLILSDMDMKLGEYTLWMDDTQLSGVEGEGGGFGGFPGNFDPKKMQENFKSEDMPKMPENFKPHRGGRPGENRGDRDGKEAEKSTSFNIKEGGSYYNMVAAE